MEAAKSLQSITRSQSSQKSIGDEYNKIQNVCSIPLKPSLPIFILHIVSTQICKKDV